MSEPPFSPDTLQLFAELLSQVQIPATHPELEAVAVSIATARRELQEALAGVAVAPHLP